MNEKKSQKKLVTDSEQLVMIRNPFKLKILKHLTTPHSASEVAKLMGESPQKTNYHFKKLKSAGLIRIVGSRAVRNLVEVLYESVAEQYIVTEETDVQNELIQQLKDQGPLLHLYELSEQIKTDTVALLNFVEDAVHVPSAALDFQVQFVNEDSRKKFLEEYIAMMHKLVSKYQAEESAENTSFKALIAVYPVVNEGGKA
jgi:DNA-binding transcriptional ArsR family regulator